MDLTQLTGLLAGLPAGAILAITLLYTRVQRVEQRMDVIDGKGGALAQLDTVITELRLTVRQLTTEVAHLTRARAA